ncbi:DUF4232 domain-containing protein [Spirillospora sp. CA-294931]|uniref:DUF4232 domain-containing protein n=1 Tax=Spirillospora sp. CA-294931 TaxID=3240042 RepID=UPI003D9200EC
MRAVWVVPVVVMSAACGSEVVPAAPRASPSVSASVWAPPPCPRSGLRVSADEADAAMGLRVMSLRIVNCGRKRLRVKGYPQVALFDAEGKALKVRVGRGAAGVATLPELDRAPGTVSLKPGEQAVAGVAWRNLVLDGVKAAETADAVDVTVSPGTAVQRVVGVNIDLGTTGKVGVGPWVRAPESQRQPSN